ncbi:hypothetical protein [Actinoplanes teichomyceticus]|nr:hypothetical protein [Actinoplanes teichomyceticus]
MYEPVATRGQVAATLTGILDGRPDDVFGRTAIRVYRWDTR